MEDTNEYVEAALFATEWLEGTADAALRGLDLPLRGRVECALRIVDQTERRILKKQTVSAA